MSPSVQAVDLLLDKLEPLKERVVRVGISHTRQDLNTKYALLQPQKGDPEDAAKV